MFDPGLAELWRHELPLDRQFVCSRNAQVVAAVLDAMPDAVRAEIVEAIRIGQFAT